MLLIVQPVIYIHAIPMLYTFPSLVVIDAGIVSYTHAIHFRPLARCRYSVRLSSRVDAPW